MLGITRDAGTRSTSLKANDIKPSATLTSTPEISSNSDTFGNTTVNYGPDGLPISYTVNNKTYQIGSEGHETMKYLKDMAASNHEPQFLMSIYQGYPTQTNEPYKGSPDRPRINKDNLPDGISTET